VSRLRRRRLTHGVLWALLLAGSLLLATGQPSQSDILVLAGLGAFWTCLVLVPRRLAPSLPRSLLARLDDDRGIELTDGRLMRRNSIRSTLIAFLALVVTVIPSQQEGWRLNLTRHERPATPLDRAVEELDHPRSAVQLAAIRALERMGRKPDERLAAIDALVAYLHRRTRTSSRAEHQLRAGGIRAALFALGRLPRADRDPPLDLRGLDLADAQLAHLVLRGADLTGANLAGADLQDADVQDARLQLAALGGANLWSANLSRAKLWGADLREAELRCANMERADLGGANLSGAPLPAANLQHANLRDTDLRHTYLGRANLREATVTGATFKGAIGSPGTRWPAAFDQSSAGIRADPFGDPNDYCLY
jgi:uncharacterized protein YjbI with pentapeptide repeats